MVNFVMATHYTMPTGLKETVEFLTGVEENIYDLSAYTNDSYNLKNEVSKLFAQFDKSDTVIIMTDIFSGSVNQCFFPYLNENVHLITGINAPLALELILSSEEAISPEYIAEKVKEAQNSIIYVNQWTPEVEEGDE